MKNETMYFNDLLSIWLEKQKQARALSTYVKYRHLADRMDGSSRRLWTKICSYHTGTGSEMFHRSTGILWITSRTKAPRQCKGW